MSGRIKDGSFFSPAAFPYLFMISPPYIITTNHFSIALGLSFLDIFPKSPVASCY